MGGTRALGGAALLAAGALLGGCANDKPKPASAKNVRHSLKHPFYPRCLPRGFVKQQIRPLTGDDGVQVWSLSYNRPAQPTRANPNPTTSLVIVESPQNTPGPTKKDWPTQKHIAGHTVGYNTPHNPGAAISAQWKTNTAHYTLLASGRQHPLIAQTINCMP
jgi:hypothetical protein